VTTDDDDLQQIINLIRRFGDRRFAEGREAARQTLFNALQFAMTERPDTATFLGSAAVYEPPGTAGANPGSESVKRAPRGSVGKAVDSVLADRPGMLTPEIEERVLQNDPEIARKSVGNELRRLEGKKYKRDRPGGHRWFLIDQPVGQKGGEPTPHPSASV
jgi:hypothetical protein